MSLYAREIAPETLDITHDTPTRIAGSGRAPGSASAKTPTPGIAPDRKVTERIESITVDNGDVTTTYLSLQDVADRIGKTRDATQKLQLPEPDVVVGSDLNARRGWSVETIDAWAAGLQNRVVIRDRILLHLPATATELAAATGGTYNAVAQTLRRMAARGEVARVEGRWEIAGSKGKK